MSSTPSAPAPQPLASMDEWEDFLKTRYPEPAPAHVPAEATLEMA